MKKFPFTKRSIEALPAHDPDSPSREAEYSDSECIGLKLVGQHAKMTHLSTCSKLSDFV